MREKQRERNRRVHCAALLVFMVSQQRSNELVVLAILALALWAITTFSLMVLWWAKGGLAAPQGQQVPVSVYNTAAEYCRVLIFWVIPTLTAGYLLVGLFLLRLVGRLKDAKK